MRFLLLFFLASNIAFCADSPSLSDVNKSTDSSKSTSGSKTVKLYRPKWEKSPDATMEAMKYTIKQLERRYPKTETKSSKMGRIWVKNDVEIELFQNVTPDELNSPDVKGQPVRGVIAVFVVKATVRTRAAATSGGMYQIGRFYSNMSAIAGTKMESPVPIQDDSQIQSKQRFFLVSLPNQSFYRASDNPFMNPMSMNVMKAAGMPAKPTEVQNKEIKALFPTNTYSFRKVDEAKLKALLSGNVSSLTKSE